MLTGGADPARLDPVFYLFYHGSGPKTESGLDSFVETGETSSVPSCPAGRRGKDAEPCRRKPWAYLGSKPAGPGAAPAALSTACRSSTAAFRGSGFPAMAETTATPSAPARITSATPATSMPPIPTMGSGDERRCLISAMAPGPIGLPASGLVAVAYIGPTPK